MQTQTLKFIVIFLAVLIMAGFTVVVLTIAHRLKGESAAPARAGLATLVLPAQSRVLDMVGTGSNNVALRVVNTDGRQSILLIDAQTGRLIETTILAPASVSKVSP